MGTNIVCRRKKKQVKLIKNETKDINDKKTDVCLNNLEQRLKLDQLVATRREKIKPITARAPDKYWKYLTFTGGYHLYNSAHYCPLLSPPASLTLSVMRELFTRCPTKSQMVPSSKQSRDQIQRDHMSRERLNPRVVAGWIEDVVMKMT